MLRNTTSTSAVQSLQRYSHYSVTISAAKVYRFALTTSTKVHNYILSVPLTVATEVYSFPGTVATATQDPFPYSYYSGAKFPSAGEQV